MPKIKNVSPHLGELHDGRPLAPYTTATVTEDDLARPHYQSRIAAGLMVAVADKEPAQKQDEKPEEKPEKPDENAEHSKTRQRRHT